MTPSVLREALLVRLRAALEARRWDYRRLAERSGLHPKTVRRLLEGQRFSLPTAERVARALGVDSNGPGAPQEPAGTRKTPQDTAELSPVVGWKAASVVLRVSEDTLGRSRRRARDTHRAWWPSPGALAEWWMGLLARSNSQEQPGQHT